MAQQFNPKRVLRQISNPLLKEFFERQGHPLDVEWGKISNAQVDDIFDAWQRLPDGPRKNVEIVFHDVHEMANEDGVRVVIEEGQYRGEDLSPVLDPMESRHDKAVWTFLNRPDVWNTAVRFAKADSLSSGRSWVKRGGVPVAEPRTDADGLLVLEEAMSAFFRERQGRGHLCKVEHFVRGGEHDYFFVYLSDYADTYINFDAAGSFQRTPERRAFEVVFAYDRTAATLEMYAKGGRKVVGPLQSIFCRTILGERLGPEDPETKPYHLDGLMDRTFGFPTDPTDSIKGVSIRCLRLSIIGRRRSRITLEADPDKGPEDIYRMLDEDLDRRRLPKSVLQVTKATLHFELNGHSRARSLTFNISHPSYCDLKSKREDVRLMGEKYLRRWKIDVA